MAEDRLDLLAKENMRVPTLALMASEDSLCPPDAMRWVADQLPHGALRTIPGSHSVYYEDPATWNAAVLAFLAESHSAGP